MLLVALTIIAKALQTEWADVQHPFEVWSYRDLQGGDIISAAGRAGALPCIKRGVGAGATQGLVMLLMCSCLITTTAAQAAAGFKTASCHGVHDMSMHACTLPAAATSPCDSHSYQSRMPAPVPYDPKKQCCNTRHQVRHRIYPPIGMCLSWSRCASAPATSSYHCISPLAY